jgi:hypothetical protein
MTTIPTAEALRAAGLSKAYAYMLLNGDRQASPSLALWLKDNHGIVLKPLVGKSADEVAVMRKLYPPQPPKSLRAA